MNRGLLNGIKQLFIPQALGGGDPANDGALLGFDSTQPGGVKPVPTGTYVSTTATALGGSGAQNIQSPLSISGGSGWYNPSLPSSEFLLSLTGWVSPTSAAGDAGIKLQPTLGASPFIDFFSDTGAGGSAKGRMGRQPNTGGASLFTGQGGGVNNALQIGNRDNYPVQLFINDACALQLETNGGLSLGTYAGVNAAPANGLIVAGNVGIGTNNPGSLLDMTGASIPVLRLTRTANVGVGSQMGEIDFYAPNASGSKIIWSGIINHVNNATAGAEDNSIIISNRVAGGYSTALTLQSNGALVPGGVGFWGHALPAAQPAAPVTLADVIAIIRGCGLSA